MTYEQWGKEIEEAPKIYDGSSKHVHTKIFADWTADREAFQTEVNRQHEGWTDTYLQLDDAAREAERLRILYDAAAIGERSLVTDLAYQRRHCKRLIQEARAHHARAEMWYHKCKEYEAFNEPLRRTYNENTAEEVKP